MLRRCRAAGTGSVQVRWAFRSSRYWWLSRGTASVALKPVGVAYCDSLSRTLGGAVVPTLAIAAGPVGSEQGEHVTAAWDSRRTLEY